MKLGVFVAAAKKAEESQRYWAAASSGCQLMGM
jgi:hypothetical protein